MKRILTLLYGLLISLIALGTDYTTLLTPERGFSEVTSLNELFQSDNSYYILASAENLGLLVGVGDYEVKPGWACEDSKALRYMPAEEEQVWNRHCYFTIDTLGGYIGLRNIVYSADLFQTHDGAGFMYVNTFTDKSLDEWSYLLPTRQADGYWLFESGKYPLSSGDVYSGYLGPWNNVVAEGEPLALNRKNTASDEAGHFRLFRISRSLLEKNFWEKKKNFLLLASEQNPIDATWLITNPSFETGNQDGWTFVPAEGSDVGARAYPITDGEGGYVGNHYTWWSGVAIEQTISDVPDGIYEISGTVATWEGYSVSFYANDLKTSVTGLGDGTGIRVSHTLTVGKQRKIKVGASRTDVDWWSEGMGDEERNKIGFLKLDDVKLICKGVYFSGTALPLPNDNETVLLANQWYYFDIEYPSEYLLYGNLQGMEYAVDGKQFADEVNAEPVSNLMSLAQGRVYFKTSRSDATLKISMRRELLQGSVTVAALNVDGLPTLINSDGPGSNGTKMISTYLSMKDYDLIGISEDFEFDDELKSNLGTYSWGSYRGSVNVSNLFSPADTDGLEFAWKSSKAGASDESWAKWTSTTSTDGNQYIKKGYRYYRVSFVDAEVDVYVLHMDAGDASVSSREAQWRQLAQAILSADASRPKLVIGDTNSRWTREDIGANFVDLLPGFSVGDAWVELCREGVYPTTEMGDLTDKTDPADFSRYEVVDKILYLNPRMENTVQFIPKSFHVEQDYIYATVQEYTDNGTPLGDHDPVAVEFEYVWAGDVKNIPGDVNGDREITVSDVTALVSIILGGDETEPYQFNHLSADVNSDGVITVSDVTALVSIILGK